jgi:hypothetical protein
MSNPMKSWPRKSFNSTSTIHKVSNVLGGAQMLVLSFVKIIHAHTHTHTFTRTTRPHMHTWKGGKGWRIGFGCEQLLYGTNYSLKGVHVYVDGLAMKIIEKAYMRTPTLIPPNQTRPAPKNKKRIRFGLQPQWSLYCTTQVSNHTHACIYMYKPYYTLKP